jgi:(2Fe-2S) ferredoxin
MQARPVPYRKVLFVCVNERPDGRVACANPGRGGDRVLSALKEAAKALGLKGRVRVARSGCLDLCAQGPNVFVWPDGLWLRAVAEPDVPAIVRAHLAPFASASGTPEGGRAP